MPKDITKEFMDACELCLEPGMIAHEPNFYLFFVMSAIDIMNPSMDIAMAKERKIVFLYDAIEDGNLPLGRFDDPKTLLGVIDELFVLFCNWLTGDSLVQTVYTCMYMHCIPIIEDNRLALFCEALRRVIIQVRRFLLASSSSKDEDFSPLTTGVPLMANTRSHFPEKKQANSYYDLPNEKIIKLLRDMNEKMTHVLNDVENALAARMLIMAHLLEFGRRFDLLLSVIDGDEFDDISRCAGTSSLNGDAPFGPDYRHQQRMVTVDLVEDTCNDLESDSAHIVECSKVMLKSADYGKEAGPGKDNPRSEYFSIPGFEPFLTLPSLTASVQRFPRNLSRSTAFSFIGCAFTRIIGVIQQMRSLLTGNSLNVVFLHELFSVAHNIGHNLCHSLFEKPEVINNLQIQDACSKSCVLSRAVMDVLMQSIVKCPLNVNERFSKAIKLGPSGMHFFSSWLSTESKWIQNCLLDSAENLTSYFPFFEHVFCQLFAVCLSWALFFFSRTKYFV